MDLVKELGKPFDVTSAGPEPDELPPDYAALLHEQWHERMRDTLLARLNNLPREARERKQWAFALRHSKAPMRVMDGAPLNASSTNPNTWMDFGAAVEAALRFGGDVGFMLTKEDPFAVIDIDAKGDVPADRLELYHRVVEAFDSYTEYSRSGKGVHIWLYGDLESGKRRDGIEVYSFSRFMICTGNLVHKSDVKEGGEKLTNMVEQIKKAQGASKVAEEDIPDELERETDEEILAKCRGAANSQKFVTLYEDGDWKLAKKADGSPYESQSEADIALVCMLAFHTGNRVQLVRLFRASQLGRREKASRDYYAFRTVRTALAFQVADRQKKRADFIRKLDTVEDINSIDWTMDVDTMLECFVEVSMKDVEIALRDRPKWSYSLGAMTRKLAHNVYKYMDVNNKEKEIPLFNLWSKNSRRRMVDVYDFNPNAGDFCYSPDGRPALNVWRALPHVAAADWQARCQPFLDHVAYLVPIQEERERFLNWLAHIEQQPGVLPHSHYLLIMPKTGTGRNWLATVLKRVWKQYAETNFKLELALQTNFNAEISQKLLIEVDEIRQGGAGVRWEHSETLKKWATEEYKTINEKHVKRFTERNFSRWLLFSNHEDALPLDDTDRRWNVILNHCEPREPEYYKKIYRLVDEPLFISSVRECLRTRNISTFNPGERAAMNMAKLSVIGASMSAEDERARDLAASHVPDVILADNLYAAVFGKPPELGDANTSRNWKLLGPIARKAGIAKLTKDLRLFGGQRPKVWILRNPERWQNASGPDVEAELYRR
ncbi:DUF5906 domain-containing protein [Xanthobacter autotrophicus]|uniref:phage NrS-1 polymerase family protein n=1 Tax=Xanthobacter autotrophicus TaxID=280 RepID=UPI001E35844F|nr:DUF5906 domain-containing protein [Xanthobacter autotrophicus]UDQ87410.1 DUF5906 domain-containing protein [Xanthobacter autotrophicus]